MKKFVSLFFGVLIVIGLLGCSNQAKEVEIQEGKINFDDVIERSFHNNISDKQQYLIDLQGRIDSNIGNNRILVPLQREFEQRKNELDILLKELFNLGEDDHLIPQITDIYATD